MCVLAAWPAQSQEIITTVAGNGLVSYSGDGSPAINAALNYPKGLAIGANGTLYMAYTGNFRVRSVSSSGIINTFAGNGVNSYSGDGGAAITAGFSDVMAVAVTSTGNVYIADASNRVVREVSAAGTVTTIAGIGTQGFSGDGGLATAAALGRAVALSLDASGNLYIVDSVNQRIRRIGTNGIITTIAGNGTSAYAGDGGPATLASCSFPLGVTVDGSGNIYVADAGNNRVRKITVSTGVISTVAGNGQAGFSGDGASAASAALNLPSDVALDGAGNLYIADAGNNRIRMVNSAGVITTIAGTSTNGFTGDGGAAALAELNYPWGLATDATGDVYIADRVNSRVRLISSNPTAPPVVPPNAVVNAASFSPTAAVAPGAIVAVFGSNLAAGSMAATQSPLPTLLNQTSVTFNGVAAPLFYVSSGQVNAQVPFNIPAGSVSVQVTRGSSTSVAEMVNVASASPGIFIVDETNQIGAIVHALSGTVVTTSAPAVAGEYLSIYCTGLGPLNMPVQSGAAGPTTAPLPQTITTPTVKIGSTSAALALLQASRQASSASIRSTCRCPPD